MSKVWVTRSRPGADKSAETLRASGFNPVVAPLLEISPPEAEPPLPPRDAVLIITSQNALNMLVAYTDTRHWRVVCVGDATASASKDYGFLDVQSAGGASEDLTQLILEQFPKSSRPFWHLSGTTVRGSIVEDLSRAGLNVERHTYYASIPVAKLPDIDLSGVSYVLFYSPLAAQTFTKFDLDVSELTAVSLSSAIDMELHNLNFKARAVAAKPNEFALIRALDCAP